MQHDRIKLSAREVAKRRNRVVGLVRRLPDAVAAACGASHLSLEVRGRRFGYYLEDHHGDGRLALNCKSTADISTALADTDPQRFHVPKYVGRLGWLGMWLDLPGTDWRLVMSVLTEAYRMVAPKSLLAKLRG